jgi:hypothetical protein
MDKVKSRKIPDPRNRTRHRYGQPGIAACAEKLALAGRTAPGRAGGPMALCWRRIAAVAAGWRVLLIPCFLILLGRLKRPEFCPGWSFDAAKSEKVLESQRDDSTAW